MWPFTARTRRTVRSLAKQVEELTEALENERSLNEQLRDGLIQVARREITPETVQKAIEAAVVQMPDGEFVAAAQYDWERLAHDMFDNDTESDTWED